MAYIKPFAALRPVNGLERKIAALPYDVYTVEEAKATASGNPYSFLHVDKAEIDLDEYAGHNNKRVYNTAAENYRKMIESGWLLKDTYEMFYVYRLEMSGRSQTGLVALTSIDEYLSGAIKRHELTREDKERDRIAHIKAVNAHTGPIFMAYKSNAAIKGIICEQIKKNEPVYDFVSEDGTRHTVWAIEEESICGSLVREFENVKSLYIADGHHRNAAAVAVGLDERAKNPDFTGDEPYNHYLSVLFPDDELLIMAYNRVLMDLNGLTTEKLVSALSNKFNISRESSPVEPQNRHEFGMLAGKEWFRLSVKPEYCSKNDVLENLDVSLLHKHIIEPLFGITDVRNDKRIDFIGGIRGVGEIDRIVAGGEMNAGFTLFPTSMSELIAVADAGAIMPPKSTWFEPKLLSGIFIHEL